MAAICHCICILQLAFNDYRMESKIVRRVRYVMNILPSFSPYPSSSLPLTKTGKKGTARDNEQKKSKIMVAETEGRAAKRAPCGVRRAAGGAREDEADRRPPLWFRLPRRIPQRGRAPHAMLTYARRPLRLRENKYVSLFISMCITNQREKYGYGYKMGTGRLKRQSILLPINDVGHPDWELMEQYMRNIESAQILKYISSISS